MTTALASASVGLIIAGPPGAFLGALIPLVAHRVRRSVRPPTPRLVMLVLLVEVRSGMSLLAALQRAASILTDHADLRRVARVATVSGLTAAIPVAGSELSLLIAQLSRAQASGASIAGVLRSMLEQELSEERARRIGRARSLPVRLMIPITLLMLPGLVLLLYAPSLLGLFSDLTGDWR